MMFLYKRGGLLGSLTRHSWPTIRGFVDLGIQIEGSATVEIPLTCNGAMRFVTSKPFSCQSRIKSSCIHCMDDRYTDHEYYRHSTCVNLAWCAAVGRESILKNVRRVRWFCVKPKFGGGPLTLPTLKRYSIRDRHIIELGPQSMCAFVILDKTTGAVVI